MAETCMVQVLFALPERCWRVSVELAAGATVAEALAIAKTAAPTVPWPSVVQVGIYGRRCDLDTPLSAGDRVELYRPLLLDPKEARRRRVHRRNVNT